MFKFTKIITVSLVGLTLCGCGFRLATTEKLSDDYTQIIFHGNNNDIFYKEILKQLRLSNVEIIESKKTVAEELKGDIPILLCSPMSKGSTLMAVGSNSQELEYNMKCSVSCNLFIKGQKGYSIKTSINRAYLNKAGATLSSNSELDAIGTESARELVNQVMFRIQNSMLVAERNKKKEEDKKRQTILKDNEPLVVVFDATNEENSKSYTINNKDDLKALESSYNKDNKTEITLTPNDFSAEEAEAEYLKTYEEFMRNLEEEKEIKAATIYDKDNSNPASLDDTNTNEEIDTSTSASKLIE